MKLSTRVLPLVLVFVALTSLPAAAYVSVSVSTNPSMIFPNQSLQVMVYASWSQHNSWCPYPAVCWPEAVRVDIWGSSGFSDVREQEVSASSSSGYFSFTDSYPGQYMQATSYYVTVTVYYRDYEVYGLYDDWGNGDTYVQPARPTISGANQLWWFENQNPSGYATSLVLFTDGGSQSQWSIVSGADKATLQNDVGDYVTLVPTGNALSGSEGDIRIVATSWWGETSDQFAITLRAPHSLDHAWTDYSCDATYVYRGRVIYVIKDQLGQDLPYEVDLNEDWTTGIFHDYAGNNWRRADPVGFRTDGAAAFEDGMFGEFPGAMPTPSCDGNSEPIQHWGQAWRIGTQSVGGGRLVQTNTLQKLRGRAIHTDVVSPIY